MANHSVGDALREVIKLFERQGIWGMLGPDQTRRLVLDIIEIGNRNDGTLGDILEDDGPSYRICAYCYGEADEYRELLCPACYARWVDPGWGLPPTQGKR